MWRLPDKFAEADQRQQGLDGGGVGQAIRAVEAPCPAQCAGGDVKQAVTELIAELGKIEQGSRFGIDGDGLALAVVEAAEFTVTAIAAVFGFDAPSFGGGQLPGLLRQMGVLRRQQDFAGAGHGAEADSNDAAGTRIEPDVVLCLHNAFSMGC